MDVHLSLALLGMQVLSFLECISLLLPLCPFFPCLSPVTISASLGSLCVSAWGLVYQFLRLILRLCSSHLSLNSG